MFVTLIMLKDGRKSVFNTNLITAILEDSPYPGMSGYSGKPEIPRYRDIGCILNEAYGKCTYIVVGTLEEIRKIFNGENGAQETYLNKYSNI
jgi:hypothetical protein